jgi:hypothetical protein
MIGCPVSKNRVLPSYLESIRGLDYPKDKIHLAFLINNCTDNTYDILYTYREEYLSDYREISLWDVDGLKPGYIDGDRYKKRDYEAFATIRNTWLTMLSDEDQYIFSVDSDNFVDSYVLKRLLSHSRDIISPLIYHNFGQFNIMKETGYQNKYANITDFPRELIQVDAVCSTVLINREVIDAGVRYEFHRQGEDLGFCSNARDSGFEIWCDATIEVKHEMLLNKTELYKECIPKWVKK